MNSFRPHFPQGLLALPKINQVLASEPDGKGMTSISGTVSEIQLGRVAFALAEFAVRLARNAGLTFSNRLDRHLCFPEQVIESAASDQVPAAIDGGSRFDIIDRGNAPMDGSSTAFANTVASVSLQSMAMIADVSKIIAAVPSRRRASDRDRWTETVL